jgi:hypothetical protein
MTQSYASGPSSGSGSSTSQAVREQAANVGQGAAEAGGRVAQTAKEQTTQVVRETGTQARNLASEAQDELRHQTSMQQKRAAEGLRALGSELRSMAGHSDQQGVAAELVQQAAGRAHQAADWLEQREPGQVLGEVRRFARRRPGVFLAGALVAGVVAGRLTRSLTGSGGATDSQRPIPAPGASTGLADVPPRASLAGEEPAGTIGYPVAPAVPPAAGITDDPVARPSALPGESTGYQGGARP